MESTRFAPSRGSTSSRSPAETITRQRKPREQFERKVHVILNSSDHETTLRLANVVYNELAGLVNDFEAVRQKLSWLEVEARCLFREETGQDLSAA